MKSPYVAALPQCVAPCTLLSLSCTSSFMLSIHHPRLFVPSILVCNARIRTLSSFILLTCPSHCFLRLYESHLILVDLILSFLLLSNLPTSENLLNQFNFIIKHDLDPFSHVCTAQLCDRCQSSSVDFAIIRLSLVR